MYRRAYGVPVRRGGAWHPGVDSLNLVAVCEVRQGRSYTSSGGTNTQRAWSLPAETRHHFPVLAEERLQFSCHSEIDGSSSGSNVQSRKGSQGREMASTRPTLSTEDQGLSESWGHL